MLRILEQFFAVISAVFRSASTAMTFVLNLIKFIFKKQQLCHYLTSINSIDIVLYECKTYHLVQVSIPFSTPV